MVKWVKVNSKEEHEALIKVWKDKVDSILFHSTHQQGKYPFWFSNNNSRQLDNGYIEGTYEKGIVLLSDVLVSLKNTIEIIIW